MSFILLGILNSQAEAAGGAGAYDLLETQVLSSSASSVTFSSIPQDYKHLQIRMVTRTDASSDWDRVKVERNGDTNTSNYTWHFLRGSGSAVDSSFSNLNFTSSTTGSSADSNSFGASILDVLDYAVTTKNGTLRSLGGNVGGTNWISLTSNLHLAVAATSSLKLLPQFGTNFVAGSRFSLYGVK